MRCRSPLRTSVACASARPSSPGEPTCLMDESPEARDQLADLVRRKLAALTGLGSLDDLDLELLGPGEVLCGELEPGARDPLDPLVRPITVGEAVVVVRILAALAGVGSRPHPVH